MDQQESSKLCDARSTRARGAMKVKNPRPEARALFEAPWKGAKSQPSDPGFVGAMENWSIGKRKSRCEGFQEPSLNNNVLTIERAVLPSTP